MYLKNLRKAVFCLGTGVLIVWIAVGVLVLNSVSYILLSYTNFFYKGVDIKTIRARKGRKAIYLIGGLQCRTIWPFLFMIDDIPKDTAIYLVEYRNCGFSIEKAADSVSRHVRRNGHNEVTFVAVSMGYQLAIRVADDVENSKIIALNPCIGKVSLYSNLQKAAVMLPLGYFTLFLIGWLSFAPVCKINGRPYYSLRLLLDQISVCVSNDTLLKHRFRADVLVLSTADNLINNDILMKELVNLPKIYSIDTVHFGCADNIHLYRDPVVAGLSWLQNP